MNTLRQRQRGVALLVALLVVALAVILVAALLDRGELAMARTRNLLRSEQAQAYAQGLETYAAQVLREQTLLNPTTMDTNASPWAVPLPPQSVPGGTISASMRDLNGCFNLNNLSGKSRAATQWLGKFKDLLGAIGVDPNLGDAVQSWLGGGQSDDTNYYLTQAVPYRPRRDLFAHVSELRLVRGMTDDAYARLAPYVCVLPPGSTINVNTATVPVIRSIDFARISEAAAEKAWSEGHASYAQLTEFRSAAGLVQAPDPNLYGVSSQYFLARGDILLDGVPFVFFSLIERRGLDVRVLARSRGSDEALTVAAPIDGESGRSPP